MRVHQLFWIYVHNIGYCAWHPLYSVAVNPQSDSALAGGVCKPSLPVLFSIIPVAFVLLAVRPHVDAPSMLLVVDILSIIAATVRPCINSPIMKLVFPPRAFVSTAIRPHVNSVALDLIVAPFSVIIGAINPLVHAATVLFATVKVPFVDATIRQSLCSDALLNIVGPLP
jgi:hypothetical protein